MPLKLFPLLALSALAAQAESVWSGVYTEAQAARGGTAYERHCSTGCHQPRLNGYGGVLAGDLFMEHWREDNLNSFFSRMKATMPRGAPASLSDAMYVDILAYVLQKNEFPEGRAELRLPALAKIQIEGKGGPAAVPEFSLVKTVGCLVKGPSGEWMLERATEAARTRDPKEVPADELKAGAAMKGTGVFHFLKITPYDAESYKLESQTGHQVEAKGFLIRKPEGATLNLTSVTTVAQKCL